jgi:hypothetical protein
MWGQRSAGTRTSFQAGPREKVENEPNYGLTPFALPVFEQTRRDAHTMLIA